jgi:hypothetical protein
MVDEKLLGVLGDMGPMAGAVFMKRPTALTKVQCDKNTFRRSSEAILESLTGLMPSFAAARIPCPGRSMASAIWNR